MGSNHPQDNSNPGANFLVLSDVMERLKKWKVILLYYILRKPRSVPLNRISATLAQVIGEHNPPRIEDNKVGDPSQSHNHFRPIIAPVEIPGQYNRNGNQPFPNVHVRLLSFDSEIEIFNRQTPFQRRLCMLGSDGRRHHFVVQSANPFMTRSDERMMQMYWFTNRLFEKNHQTMKRDLRVLVPVVVPVTPRLRLIEDEANITSLSEIYEQYCHSNGKDPDEAIMYIRKRLSDGMIKIRDKHNSQVKEKYGNALTDGTYLPQDVQKIQETMKDALGNAIDLNMKEQQEEAYAAIQSTMVPNTVLMKYIDKTLVDPAAIWAFKHSFATQLGMNFLFCFILNIRDRYPQKFLFNRESARICLTEMRPQYLERYQERGIGVIEKYEIEESFKAEVPLRFTGNLQSIIPPFLSDGVLAPSMGASALALHSRMDLLRPYLYLLFRDDLLAWWMNLKSQRPIAEYHQQQKERESMPALHQNIVRVTERLTFCAPTLPSSGIPGVTGNAGLGIASANQSPVDHKIHQLLEVSRSHKRISHMNLVWMPFL